MRGFACASLAVAVMVGIGLLGLRLRPYWVAKYRGRGADLRGAAAERLPELSSHSNSDNRSASAAAVSGILPRTPVSAEEPPGSVDDGAYCPVKVHVT